MKKSIAPKTRVRRKNFFKEYGPSYVMIAPSLIMFILMTLYPLGWVFSNAFFETDGASFREFVGLENFARMMTDKVWWNSVVTTLDIAVRQLILQVPISLVLAAILNAKIRAKGFFRMAYYLPSVTSAAVMSLVFGFMFSPYNGVVNAVLKAVGIQTVDWMGNSNSARWAVSILAFWASFGQNVLIFLSGMQSISPEVYESADLDGAGKVRQFFSVTLPLLAPVLKTVLMLALIGSLKIMEPVMIMTNGGPNHGTETMSLYIYNMFFANSTMPQYGYGAALGIGATVVIGVITLVYNLVSRKLDDIV